VHGRTPISDAKVTAAAFFDLVVKGHKTSLATKWWWTARVAELLDAYAAKHAADPDTGFRLKSEIKTRLSNTEGGRLISMEQAKAGEARDD